MISKFINLVSKILTSISKILTSHIALLFTLIYLFVFILGTIVGSFLNVLIYRLPRGKPIVASRSACPKCKHKLAWCDLIPLLSWIWLRGKCRYCKEKISWQYPIIELAVGIIFIFTFMISWPNGQQALTAVCSRCPILLDFNIISFIFILFILSSLLVIFVIDLKRYIIPDKILYPAILVTVVYRIITSLLVIQDSGISQLPVTDYVLRVTDMIYNPLLSSLGASAFFLALILITKGKGMGFGDVKYAAFMGLLLGYPAIIVGLYAAFLTGAVIGVILILTKKRKFGQIIPFGPFLVFGTVVAMYFGDYLWRLFASLY